jgi:hypothetical protein
VIARALAVWCLLLLLAVLNGGVRDTWLSPALGDTPGRAISTVLLSLLILMATRLTVRWIGPRSAGSAMAIGALWVVLTLAFEFGVGHYGFGKSWAELLADYDLLRGRIWILVLLVTFLAPLLTARLRGMLADSYQTRT